MVLVFGGFGSFSKQYLHSYPIALTFASPSLRYFFVHYDVLPDSVLPGPVGWVQAVLSQQECAVSGHGFRHGTIGRGASGCDQPKPVEEVRRQFMIKSVGRKMLLWWERRERKSLPSIDSKHDLGAISAPPSAPLPSTSSRSP